MITLEEQKNALDYIEIEESWTPIRKEMESRILRMRLFLPNFIGENKEDIKKSINKGRDCRYSDKKKYLKDSSYDYKFYQNYELDIYFDNEKDEFTSRFNYDCEYLVEINLKTVKMGNLFTDLILEDDLYDINPKLDELMILIKKSHKGKITRLMTKEFKTMFSTDDINKLDDNEIYLELMRGNISIKQIGIQNSIQATYNSSKTARTKPAVNDRLEFIGNIIKDFSLGYKDVEFLYSEPKKSILNDLFHRGQFYESINSGHLKSEYEKECLSSLTLKDYIDDAVSYYDHNSEYLYSEIFKINDYFYHKMKLKSNYEALSLLLELYPNKLEGIQNVIKKRKSYLNSDYLYRIIKEC